MKLVRHEPVPVVFKGLRAAVGPLTLGQLNILRWLEEVADPYYAYIDWNLDVPDGTRIADVAESLLVLLERHEGLRTVFRAGGSPTQHVVGDGDLRIELYSVGDQDAGRADGDVQAELARRVRAIPVDAQSLPLRVAFLVDGELVRAGVFVCSHLAADFQAVSILDAQFAQLLRDPAARQPGPPRYQPLERARDEASEAMRSRLERTLVHWEQQFQRMPPQLYALPRTSNSEASANCAASSAVTITSPAAAVALEHIAQRTSTRPSAIVLAAICALISQRTGSRRHVLTLMSGNRFERRLADFVGTLAQSSLAEVDTDAESFDSLVKRTVFATAKAGKHGLYDIDKQMRIRRGVEHDRGVRFVLEPMFNNLETDAPPPQHLRPSPLPEMHAALARTRLTRQPMSPNRILLRFDLVRTAPYLVLRSWSGDTARTTETDMELLLQAAERILTAAAQSDFPLDRLPEICGLVPIARGPEWLLVDSCWIETSEAQRLVETALPHISARVFASVDGRPLVAYLVAHPELNTPAQAHARCMANLLDLPIAMAPRWYVVCETAPADLSDLGAWKAQPLVREGSGRD